MTQFKILAQHQFSSQRITKTISARDENHAYRLFAAELEDCCYYVVQINRA